MAQRDGEAETCSVTGIETFPKPCGDGGRGVSGIPDLGRSRGLPCREWQTQLAAQNNLPQSISGRGVLLGAHHLHRCGDPGFEDLPRRTLLGLAELGCSGGGNGSGGGDAGGIVLHTGDEHCRCVRSVRHEGCCDERDLGSGMPFEAAVRRSAQLHGVNLIRRTVDLPAGCCAGKECGFIRGELDIRDGHGEVTFLLDSEG